MVRNVSITSLAAVTFFSGISVAASVNIASASTLLRPAVTHRPEFASATYAIKDVGAPPSSYSSFSQPLGFNKTGQIVGNAAPAFAPASNYQHCVAWTGRGWVDIGGPTSLSCFASAGVSDANSQGVFAAVGSTYAPTTDNLVGYYATVSPKGATRTIFEANSPSQLWTMNATGVAAGYSYYAPFDNFSTNEPTFTTTGTTLSLLQPGCTTAKQACVSTPYSYTGTSGESRSINAKGTVLALALNGAQGQYVEYTGGSKPTSSQFSLPNDGNNGPAGVRGMDDKGDVVYFEFNSASSKYLTRVYSPSTKSARNLGVLAGSSCTQYIPLYVNGPGRVLGIAQGCSFASDQTYWTWDSTSGMVAVGFNHSAYSYAYLYLINDVGQVVGDFYTTAGIHHWAYLTPPTKL